MKFSNLFLLVCCVPMIVQAGSDAVQPAPTGHLPAHVIPAPARMTVQPGAFQLTPDTVLVAQSAAEISEAKLLSDQLARATGFALKTAGDGQGIRLRIAETGTGPEGYTLVATVTGAEITGQTATGLFHGIQTFLQLLPPAVYGGKPTDDTRWQIPAVSIKDEPVYPWRGMHLDVGRHFFTVAEVKRFIDYAAMHKMNVFHWHLTEDQGWRIEIKKYPKLTETGATRDSSPARDSYGRKQDGVPYGPFFYTQDQIREVVAYAAARHIDVVPEIEMPGHSVAALTAYPQFGCTGGPYKVRTTWGISNEVFCAGNDDTYKFIEDILDEVCDLFPSKYIHIGGDECPKDNWNRCTKCQARITAEQLKNGHELQRYFVTRIGKYIDGKGRRMIGWDEIMEGGLAANATVMAWRGAGIGVNAAKAGHDVIMTPRVAYLAFNESTAPGEPEGFRGPVSLADVYAFDPSCGQTGEVLKHILGSEGCCWSEYFQDFSKVEYNIHPRMSALAEVLWTPRSLQNLGDFQARLPAQIERLKAMGSNYRDPGRK